jgi:hypothetical protein
VSQTTWYFVRAPDGQLARYPRTRFERFYRGAEPVGYDLADAACFIEVELRLSAGKPVRLVGSSCPRFVLGADQRIRTDHLRFLPDPDAPPRRPGSPGAAPGAGIISIEPRLVAGRQLQAREWTPTPDELDRARDAINSAAGTPIVTHDGRRLRDARDRPTSYPPLRLV